jgi:hypothetical protein
MKSGRGQTKGFSISAIETDIEGEIYFFPLPCPAWERGKEVDIRSDVILYMRDK